VRFRRLVRNLRELQDLSEDAADKLRGEWILDRSYVAAFVAEALDRAREVVFDAAVLTAAPSSELYARLDAVRGVLARLMAAPPTALPCVEGAGGEWANAAHLQEPEYRLLHGAVQRLALADETMSRPRHSREPRLAGVVRDAHEGALRSMERLRLESWGRRAGRPLMGTSLPGRVRVVDVGGGAAPPGERVWRSRLEWSRIRSAPLRALAEAASGVGRECPGAHALAVVSEEHATVDLAWPGGAFLIDACLGEHAAGNLVYCALRGGSTQGGVAVGRIVDDEGFSRPGLGPGLTAWVRGRGYEESRRALRRLGGAMSTLVGTEEKAARPNGA
jgi:hypothetical protein